MEDFKITTSKGFIPLLVALGFVTTAAFFFRVKHVSNEPPFIAPTLPVIGHAVGFFRRNYKYYIDLSVKYKLQIYSLAFPGMPGGRVYVISSPELALAAQRQWKTLSFWDVEAAFTVGMAGLSKMAAKALTTNVAGEESAPSLFMEGLKSFQTELKSGAELDNLSRASAQKLALSIAELDGNNETKEFDLWEWVNFHMMESVTSSVYGPKNPLQNRNIAQAFLDFKDNALGLISYPVPSLTCSKAYSGREKLVAAFRDYYTNNGLDTASHFCQERLRIMDAHDLSSDDKARFDPTFIHALIANTTSTAFWTLYHMFSDPEVLAEIRSVLMLLLTVRVEDGKTYHEIDVSAIREVPILKSILHESLRHYASGTGTRIVLEDTMLDNRYLLKKGCFVFMPNQSYHFNATAWGDTVANFDAHRFMKSKDQHSGAFRGFGGGVNLCPGRLLAMNAVLAMCAMFALRYDMKPVSGTWAHPSTDNSNLSVVVHPPKEKVAVKILAREGFTGGSWAFKL